MVDNEMALTFSVRNNPGVYALLLGSGVSTDAGVPTGWGIVEDLIRKLADAQEEDPDPDPFKWYEDSYDQEPEYDTLIEQLAPSKEERQSLLEKYFEPTDQEREQGIKTPTEAHRSIAWLIDEDYINVVITTNFDRLLEQALSERGVTPVVISSPADAEGAAPLDHQDAVILKINGDYKEVNIKNITEELQSYDPAIEDLLTQIFHRYGLIVCGWSGKWDMALRETLLSCEDRRYSTYWAYHGELEDSAEKLISHRDAESISISGASNFFSELKERVQSLEGAESGAPLTRDIARERVKRYMSQENRKIDLTDLLRDETNEARSKIRDEERFPLDIDLNNDNLNERLNHYENTVGTLAMATSTCAYWGPEVANSGIDSLSETVRRLGTLGRRPGRKSWRDLRLYPASFILYGMGVAAVKSENWKLIQRLLNEVQIKAPGFPEQRAGSILNPWKVGGRIGSGGDGNKLLRNRLKDNLREPLIEFIPDESGYEYHFHKFEILMDLVLLDYINEGSKIDGNNIHTLYFSGHLDEIGNDIEAEGENWGLLQAGMFDGSVDRAEFLLGKLQDVSRY